MDSIAEQPYFRRLAGGSHISTRRSRPSTRATDRPAKTSFIDDNVPQAGDLREKQVFNGLPRKIHYIWFGGRPLPALTRTLVAGWKKVMPDHEVIEWNEGNFDVTAHPYMRRMHAEGHFAFASDYARLCILRDHGGIYLDTDVELKKSLDPFRGERCFLSFEMDTFLSTCVIGSVPGHPLISALLEDYEGRQEGIVNNVLITEHFLLTYPEFRLNNRDQVIGHDIRVLPKEYLIVPSWHRQKNFSLHHANNQWKQDNQRSSFTGLMRALIPDVLFYKLVNLRMSYRSAFKELERTRRKSGSPGDQQKRTRAEEGGAPRSA